MAAASERAGVEFRYGTAVQSIQTENCLVKGLVVGDGSVIADRYVLAAGSHTTSLAKTCGIDLPVKPAKGYSITVRQAAFGCVPQIPVVDDALHAVIVSLDDRVRAAGTAEFAGFNLDLVPARVRNVRNLLRSVFPEMKFDDDAAVAWAGLRPMSADGVPVIGPTRFPNLFFNTGHGHLGWTMAAGSARLLADLLSGKAPVLDLSPYHLARFAAAPG
jgi:D-amino-acid dehydrogenase